jgi:hypothetical protein
MYHADHRNAANAAQLSRYLTGAEAFGPQFCQKFYAFISPVHATALLLSVRQHESFLDPALTGQAPHIPSDGVRRTKSSYFSLTITLWVDSVTRVPTATRIGFFGFPQLAGSLLDEIAERPGFPTFSLTWRPKNEISRNGRRVGGFLIFRFRRRI